MRTGRPRKGKHPPADIIVREGRLADLPALLTIYNDAVRTSAATFDLTPQTLSQRKKWFEGHGRRHPLVVAESRGQVVGYATLSEFRDKPGYSRSVEDSVYVRCDFQGRGVGSALLREIVCRAENLGYHTIVAANVPPSPASAFTKSWGSPTWVTSKKWDSSSPPGRTCASTSTSSNRGTES